MTLPDPDRWARLSPLFDELMDLDEAARRARLLVIEQATPDLADDLRRMLAAEGQARSAGFMAGAVMPAADSPAQANLAGQRMGAYVLVSHLGQGGSGSVWRARREDGRFEGEVALKILHLALLGQSGAERFRREGSILARLAHPHIARLLDAGVTAAAQPYLVIELVHGQRLDHHCEALSLDTDARLRLFGCVLQAVAHAHLHLVVHRDIKPSNILVSPAGEVKLLDFGIAKLISGDDAEEPTTALTRDWGRVMTPEYAAPEQLRGDSVTTATDVYALGVLLYELLTGELPFPDRRRGGAQSGAHSGVHDSVPPRPSARVADARLRRRLSGDLDTIVMRTLKAEPADRYPTASALLDDITRHLSGHAVLARGESWLYRLRKWVGRHRAATAVTAGVMLALLGGAHAQVAVLLALAAGTLLALWQARSARAQAAAAQAAQRRAEEVKKFIASIFAQAQPREGSGGVVTALALLQSATQRIEAELAAQPATAGELGVMVGESCSSLGDLLLGRQALDAAVPRCRRALGDLHPTTLQGRVLQLEAANGSSQYDRVRALAPAVLADLRSQHPVPVEKLVSALRETSFALAKLNDAAASLAPLREAVALADAQLGPLHGEALNSLGLLSNTLSRFGQHTEALQFAEQALERTQRMLGGARPHTLLSQSERWYADALFRNGRPADAEPIARQVVLDQTALDGEVSRRVVNAMASHTMALANVGRTEDAVALAREVVARYAAWSTDADDDAVAFSYTLAYSLLPTRRVDETHLEIDRGELLGQQLGTEMPRAQVRRQRMRAQLLAWAGDGSAARALLDSLEDSARVAEPLEWARLPCVRAMSWRLQGDWLAGLTAAREALERGTATDAPAALRAHAHTELGLLLLETGDLADATEHLEQAERLYEQVQLQPSVLNADLLLGLGRLHLLAGRRDAARQQFSQVESLWARSNPGSRWHEQAQQCVAQADAL